MVVKYLGGARLRCALLRAAGSDAALGGTPKAWNRGPPGIWGARAPHVAAIPLRPAAAAPLHWAGGHCGGGAVSQACDFLRIVIAKA